ncbi:hypothetical protein HCU67_08880 [Muricauda sp. DJ-13]|uniref:Uncharacterized protein n=1 Tax=Croceivirga thetidis TaxID=2721623 RepID=A0ABX1GQ55_9FLAO|nr:hypothetical protein [Croceivirga thetidis]
MGCSSISVVNSWKNPEIVLFDANKVLIVGLTPDSSIQENFETKMQAEFERFGVASMRSIDLFDIEFTSSEKSEAELNEFEELLIQRDFDAILFTKVIGFESKKTLGQKIDDFAKTIYGSFQEDYLSNQKIYFEDEYRKEFMVYNLQTSLYCICVGKERELIWRGTLDVNDKKNMKRVLNEYVDFIVDSLQKENIIFRDALSYNASFGL